MTLQNGKNLAAPGLGPPASGVENILVLGATSGIGRAVAHEMARESNDGGKPCRLLLAGRDMDELERMAADLRLRYKCAAAAIRFDAQDFDSHAAFFRESIDRFTGDLAGVVLCHGWMADADEARASAAVTRRMIDINFTSAVSVLDLAADYLESRKVGFICAVSSVAGDRGRQSNYPYGSTKAALTCYLQGLRNRLFRSGVAVVTVKPGFVDTGMTWGLLNPKSPLLARPEKVARDICRAIRRRKNEVYTPWFWWGIMTIIRSIPEPIFKRLKL